MNDAWTLVSCNLLPATDVPHSLRIYLPAFTAVVLLSLRRHANTAVVAKLSVRGIALLEVGWWIETNFLKIFLWRLVKSSFWGNKHTQIHTHLQTTNTFLIYICKMFSYGLLEFDDSVLLVVAFLLTVHFVVVMEQGSIIPIPTVFSAWFFTTDCKVCLVIKLCLSLMLNNGFFLF